MTWGGQDKRVWETLPMLQHQNPAEPPYWSCSFLTYQQQRSPARQSPHEDGSASALSNPCTVLCSFGFELKCWALIMRMVFGRTQSLRHFGSSARKGNALHRPYGLCLPYEELTDTVDTEPRWKSTCNYKILLQKIWTHCKLFILWMQNSM